MKMNVELQDKKIYFTLNLLFYKIWTMLKKSVYFERLIESINFLIRIICLGVISVNAWIHNIQRIGIIYRVSYETWQFVNSFECLLPYLILKTFCRLFRLKKSFTQRNWVLVTNSDFLIPISSQPNVVDLVNSVG